MTRHPADAIEMAVRPVTSAEADSSIGSCHFGPDQMRIDCSHGNCQLIGLGIASAFINIVILAR